MDFPMEIMCGRKSKNTLELISFCSDLHVIQEVDGVNWI